MKTASSRGDLHPFILFVAPLTGGDIFSLTIEHAFFILLFAAFQNAAPETGEPASTKRRNLEANRARRMVTGLILARSVAG
jgi:hypothetical protein